MKKVLSILVIGVVILFLLSFVRSSTLNQDVSLTSSNDFALTVPAAPPKSPPIK